MSDDHKLLIVMLEEELGVGLECCDHPLKQSAGAGIGAFLSVCILLIGYLISPLYGLAVSAYIVLAATAYIMAKIERLSPLPIVIWNVAVIFLASTTTYFLTRLWS